MPRRLSALEQRLRLASGLILAVYVVLHLSNHTLGLLSLDTMERWRWVNTRIWHHPLGTVALYGSLAIHFLLALRSLYRRTTLRMPAWEAAQLGSGLLIPLMLAGHVIGTRISEALLDFDVRYVYVVSVLWNDDWLRTKQTILVLLVWAHVLVGLHFWLRLRRWYAGLAPFLLSIAVLLPVLALLGFMRAGFETEELLADPEARQTIFFGWTSAEPERQAFVRQLARWAPWVVAVVVAVVLAARGLRRALVTRGRRYYLIHHSSGQRITARVGQSVLEALRNAGVPHASVCGGRARCTTCRIRIGEGLAALHVPSALETNALHRIGAAPNVRLACQTRPVEEVTITPLLPARVSARATHTRGGVSGREQHVTAMFVDLRDSTKLGEERLPYDVVFILNQFFAEMSAALDATNGHYAQFAGDGLMALYGLESEVEEGCRDAIRGAIEITRRIGALNQRLSPELREPLRVGIGIHTGEAIVGTMGPPSSPNFSAIGDNINIAARLEAQTKVLECSLVISAASTECAGANLSAFPLHETAVRGRDEPVAVYAIDDPLALPAMGTNG